jgi:hypothetical protein
MALRANSTKHLKREIMPILYKLLQKFGEEEKLNSMKPLS